MPDDSITVESHRKESRRPPGPLLIAVAVVIVVGLMSLSIDFTSRSDLDVPLPPTLPVATLADAEEGLSRLPGAKEPSPIVWTAVRLPETWGDLAAVAELDGDLVVVGGPQLATGIYGGLELVRRVGDTWSLSDEIASDVAIEQMVVADQMLAVVGQKGPGEQPVATVWTSHNGRRFDEFPLGDGDVSALAAGVIHDRLWVFGADADGSALAWTYDVGDALRRAVYPFGASVVLSVRQTASLGLIAQMYYAHDLSYEEWASPDRERWARRSRWERVEIERADDLTVRYVKYLYLDQSGERFLATISSEDGVLESGIGDTRNLVTSAAIYDGAGAFLALGQPPSENGDLLRPVIWIGTMEAG